MHSRFRRPCGTVEPVPVPDAGDAAAVWRSEKLKDFIFRIRCLRLEDNSDLAGLVAQIAQETRAVEELAQKQKEPGFQPKWWQDGEYDSARADSCNDDGMKLLRAGQHSAAFDSFTEAIRLCPSSPVYHANRAAVALKLGRANIAADDADNAAQRDPAYLRALLRGGKARLLQRQPELAEQRYRQALDIDPACAAAIKGLVEAAELAEAIRRQAAAEQEAAQQGSRPGLTRMALPEAEAVAQLYTAEQMLAANPGLLAARCAHAEALLLCQRYRDAEASCDVLPQGTTERLYLEAEAAWRQGSVAAGIGQLEQAVSQARTSQKCHSLLAHIRQLRALEERAELALEDGLPQSCIDACGALLDAIQPRACVGLACSILRLRASAHAARAAWPAALADLDAALALDAGHADCLLLRAEVHKHMGAFTASFLDLQRLKKAAPGTPGLFALLEQAAGLSLGAGPQEGRACGDHAAVNAGGGAAVDEALQVLGIPTSATTAQAKRAYRKLAAKWHPDKWATGTIDEQAAAEEKFKELQKAYELLTDS